MRRLKNQSYLFSINNFYISHIWVFYIKMYIFTYYLQQIWHVLICFFPTILHHENVFLVHLLSISKWKHIIKVVMMSASFGWSASLVEMWSGYIIFRRSNMTIYVPPYVCLYLCRLLVGTHFLWFNLILNAGYVQYIYEV